MNQGKKFEQDFKNSVPSDVFFYRFRDGTASFEKNDNVRFQMYNIADCEIFFNRTLFILELKSIADTSLSYSNIFYENKKSSMKKKEDLYNAGLFDGIISGYVVNFRKYKRTWFMSAKQLNEYLNSYHDLRKSIPVGYFNEYCTPIFNNKLKSKSGYEVKRFLQNITEDNIQVSKRLYE